jgi:hypothetical protein
VALILELLTGPLQKLSLLAVLVEIIVDDEANDFRLILDSSCSLDFVKSLGCWACQEAVDLYRVLCFLHTHPQGYRNYALCLKALSCFLCGNNVY